MDALVESLLQSDTLRVGLRELRDGEVVYVADSRLTAELLGRTPTEIAGRTATELGLPAPLVAQCKALVTRAAATRATVHGTFSIDTEAGTRELGCTVVPVPGTARQLVFLEEREGVRDPVVAALVHEIANPLLAVTANLEIAARRLAQGARADELDALVSDAR